MAVYPGRSAITNTPPTWSHNCLTPPAFSQQPPTTLHHEQPRHGHDGTGTTEPGAGAGTRNSSCHPQETSKEEGAPGLGT